jgi:hypothetical protein
LSERRECGPFPPLTKEVMGRGDRRGLDSERQAIHIGIRTMIRIASQEREWKRAKKKDCNDPRGETSFGFLPQGAQGINYKAA